MQNKARISITLNNNNDGLKISSSWESREDREMIESVLETLIKKIEYIKVDISPSGGDY